MFEAMELVQEGNRTYSFKIRKGFFKTLDAAKAFAKTKAKGVPYVQIQGRCVWSPMHDRLGKSC